MVVIEGPATNHYRPPTPVELLQPCPHRHVFQEARQHRFTAIRRCSNDHAIRLEAAQLTWGEICHDHNFSSDQRLRCIRLRDPRYDLPGFAAKIDLEAQQLVRPFDPFGYLDLSNAQFNLCEVVDADLSIRCDCSSSWLYGLRCTGRRVCHRRGRLCLRGAGGTSSLIFEPLHLVDRGLIGTRKYSLYVSQFSAELKL